MATLRFNGTIKSWNEERGFGFIEPTRGGQDIFVHAKAIAKGTVRPQAGQRVTFEVESGGDGKKRACRVELPGKRARSSASRTPKTNATACMAIAAFVLTYIAAAILWPVPAWVAGLYVASSIACFIAYAVDKSAAQAGRWRISESTLLMLGLAGGWPGAIVAQQVLRHKSTKASFRAVFRVTVAMNIAAFVVLVSPLRALLFEMLAAN